ncbi:hypothetical protein EDB19DRAFT_1827899 [Suillus lakei]|nr:hypothetical protein EDB19DRAFT_1827899 [Suillus lakei]
MKPAILPYTSELLVHDGVVNQPPIPHVQQYRCALVQPLGVCCKPTVNVPTAPQCAVVSCPSIPTSADIIQVSANFPPENTSLVHTHASYSNQPIPELIANDDCKNWTLTLNVPIPGDMSYPTLTSFSYTLKYSTAGDRLASVVRTNVRLVTTDSGALQEGISTDLNTYQDGMNVVPQTSGVAAAACLSSMPGVKDNDLEGQWSHFVDRQQIPLRIRIIKSSRLYLQFHVAEYPTAAMQRSLSVDISATWAEDQEASRLLQQLCEAQKRADAAEARLAELQKQNKEDKIKAALSRLPESRRCTGGYDWIEVADGYQCGGGSHKISFKEFNAA